jgi:Zn-dependent M16 (insulinase) family peptidase
VLEAAAAKAPLPPIVTTPPMTLDDNLAYTVDGRVFAATIDSMQSTRLSFAFALDRVPADRLMYLALLPSLLTSTGIAGPSPIPSDVMKERLRVEVLELSAAYDRDLESGRVELVISGAGNTPAETITAVEWMQRVMTTPDWTLANLPRLRDVVDQTISSYRQVMKGAEESWVRDPHEAWWRQSWPIHLHTHSFLTQLHDLHRLRWQLMANNDPTSTQAAADLLRRIATTKASRADLTQLAIAMWDAKTKELPATKKYWKTFRALSAQAGRIVAAAGKDLQALLADIQDDSLAHDCA